MNADHSESMPAAAAFFLPNTSVRSEFHHKQRNISPVRSNLHIIFPLQTFAAVVQSDATISHYDCRNWEHQTENHEIRSVARGLTVRESGEMRVTIGGTAHSVAIVALKDKLVTSQTAAARRHLPQGIAMVP